LLDLLSETKSTVEMGEEVLRSATHGFWNERWPLLDIEVSPNAKQVCPQYGKE
jgi:hypothetical protein